MVTDAELALVLDQVPALRGRTSVEDLAGGLTNRNLKITTPDGVLVARVSSSDAALLGIDRDAEHDNTRAAAEAGVGAHVVDYRPDLGMLVITFLPGSALTNESFRDPGVLHRAAAACRQLHAGPALHRRVRHVHPAGGLPRDRQGAGLPAARGLRPVRRRLRRRPGARSPRTRGRLVPCNNDLLAGNFLDDGERVRLIDYEYSGKTTPASSSATPRPSASSPRSMTEAWTEAYFGALRPRGPRPGPAAVAVQRVRLVAVGLHPGRRQPDRLRLP